MGFPEPDLQDAAANCFIDLLPTAQTTDVTKSTRTTVLNFCAVLKGTFAEDNQKAYPVLDLLAILAAQASDMTPIDAPSPFAPTVTFPADLSAVVYTLYKLLWLTIVLSDSGFDQNQISTAQADAVLAAYNTSFNI